MSGEEKAGHWKVALGMVCESTLPSAAMEPQRGSSQAGVGQKLGRAWGPPPRVPGPLGPSRRPSWVFCSLHTCPSLLGGNVSG